MLVASGAFKWFKRASRVGLIEPYGGGDTLFVHRASLDGSVGATRSERVEFEWRDGGMGREAINVVAPAHQGAVVAESSTDTAELRCGECGYGIMVSGEPPACPMCRASAWQAFVRPVRHR